MPLVNAVSDQSQSTAHPKADPIDLRWWGKAGAGSGWHPLVAHSLDVAASGRAILASLPMLESWVARRLNLTPTQTRNWVSFWLVIHDLGKFAESFQSQRRDLFLLLRRRAPDPGRSYSVRHDSLGMLLWAQVLRPRLLRERWFGVETEDLADGLDFWMRACAGHHGQPPSLQGYWADHFNPADDPSAAIRLLDAARTLFLTDDVVAAVCALTGEEFLSISQELSWWMAGLTVLSDWLGSNTDYFPYLDTAEQPAPLLADYWSQAIGHAQRAVEACGVVPPPAAPNASFADLFPSLSHPSPLQRWAADVALTPGPQVHCLEDVTGAGKTEAALMLLHRLISGGHASGFFIALPTMATANAMYARVASAYARLFVHTPSLTLATSSSRMSDAFAASIVEQQGSDVLPADADEGDPEQHDDTASARCAAWLASHHKRALLAPTAVGTVDQALMAVLHSKHQSLRLLGLHRKVLVVDEVHACDDYMLHVLCVLLEFHAHAGGSAVLLSATLPHHARRKLLAAYARGLGQAAPRADSTAYPLVTSWPSPQLQADQASTFAIDTRPDVRRRVSVVQHECIDDVERLVRQALARGQCVCWVRNTVADAVDAYERFASSLPAERLWLFHARFALHDRLAMEHQVLQAFGTHSGPLERSGRLLIATQVVEQSLDVDFDVLVSDLAPIDRLIQRAGRLRRHRRRGDGTPQAAPDAADARGEIVLHLLCPRWADQPHCRWFKDAFPKAAAVYPNHAHAWLTMKALRGGGFTMPDDARSLVEGVFGAAADVPAGLQANAQAATGQGYAAQSQAMTNTLSLRAGYSRTQTQGADWWSDAHTPSRLGEPSSTVTLARWDGQRLRPWADRSSHAWAYSSLRMATRSVAAIAEPQDPALRVAVEAAMQELPAEGRWTVLLPLRLTPRGWIGEALAPAMHGRPARRRSWRYDPHCGLMATQPYGDAVTPEGTDEDPDT